MTSDSDNQADKAATKKPGRPATGKRMEVVAVRVPASLCVQERADRLLEQLEKNRDVALAAGILDRSTVLRFALARGLEALEVETGLIPDLATRLAPAIPPLFRKPLGVVVPPHTSTDEANTTPPGHDKRTPGKLTKDGKILKDG